MENHQYVCNSFLITIINCQKCISACGINYCTVIDTFLNSCLDLRKIVALQNLSTFPLDQRLSLDDRSSGLCSVRPSVRGALYPGDRGGRGLTSLLDSSKRDVSPRSILGHIYYSLGKSTLIGSVHLPTSQNLFSSKTEYIQTCFRRENYPGCQYGVKHPTLTPSYPK